MLRQKTSTGAVTAIGRVSSLRTAGLVVLTAAVLAGCGGTTVTGTPEAGGSPPTPSNSESQPDTSSPDSAVPETTPNTPEGDDLSALLIDPSMFPPAYQAVVLPPQAVAQAAQDLEGIAAGATVEPPVCVPEPRSADPSATALMVATQPEDRATISIELSRVDTTLAEREDLWQECAEVQATSAGVTSTVRTEVVPPPPLGVDETLALRREVSSGGQAGEITQSMLSLLAQVDDVRITATYMSFGALQPDTATLDRVFTDAVQKVKAEA